MQLGFFNIEQPRNSVICGTGVLHQNTAISKARGLQYISDFLTPTEQDELILAIQNENWITDLKRRVQHYGWRYDYKLRSIDYSMYLGELPSWARAIGERLVRSNYLENKPDQLIVNEYKPGQGIANHVDCEPCFGNTIISVSLGTRCIMDFINVKTKEKIETVLEPGSLVIIADESRYQWSHGIAARKTDRIDGVTFERRLRISLTFRNVIVH